MRVFRLADVSIRTKLILLLLALILVPFLLYTTIVVNQLSQQMEDLGFRTADLVLDQSARFVESRVDLIKRSLDLLSLDPTIRELAVADPRQYSEDAGLWIRDASRIRQVENFIGQNNPDIRSFVLYTVGGLGASLSKDESREFLSVADQAGKSWYVRLNGENNSLVWFSSAVPFDHSVAGDLHALRRIPDDLNLSATSGWARADVKVRSLEEILDQAQFSERSAAFLIDGTGALIAGSKAARALGPEVLTPLAAAGPGAWSAAEAAGIGYQVGSRPIGQTPWRLVMGVPHQDIGAFGDQSRNLLLLVLALILPLMVPLSLWAASSSTRRLQLLLAGVRRVAEGGFDVELPEIGQDEFGELTRNFNVMVGRIHTLVEDQYRLGVEVKNLELQALQAQINPHFLYNTLDLINGLALAARQDRISETTLALSRFYRLTLSGGAETIPLSREFDHAATYVHIQNLRFGDAVTLVVDWEPRWKQMPVLKMLLQPLVENSILHGILEKPSEKGTITLRARTLRIDGDDWLGLEVEDDGVGMEGRVLAELLSREREGKGPDDHGYGVFNIDRRLRLRYGEASGLAFESTPGQGTVVRIRIPALPLEP